MDRPDEPGEEGGSHPYKDDWARRRMGSDIHQNRTQNKTHEEQEEGIVMLEESRTPHPNQDTYDDDDDDSTSYLFQKQQQ